MEYNTATGYVAFYKQTSTVVETSATKELLLNYGLELKKLHDEFY